MPHGVGGGHCFNHEGGREVGHEGEHHDESGAETPSSAPECCRERQGTRAHDQVEDVDEPGHRGVERRSSVGARSGDAYRHVGPLDDPYLCIRTAERQSSMYENSSHDGPLYNELQRTCC